MMRARFVIATIGATAAVCAQQADRPDRVAQLRQVFAQAHDRGGFSGNVLVAERGAVVLEASFGIADDETGAPIRRDSVFELASVSKPITAVTVLRLVQRGRLDLDDAAAKHLAGFPWPGVTVRHLLTHTSGMIGHARFFEQLGDVDRPIDNAAVMTALLACEDAPASEPGTVFDYNNLNYIALAAIIESAAERPFARVVSDEVFAEAGMDSAWLANAAPPPDLAARLVRSYVRSADGAGWQRDERAPGWEFTALLGRIVGDGGVRAAARDLLHFDAALFSGRLLEEDTLATMLEPAKSASGEVLLERSWTVSGYGLGWRIAEDRASVWHTGDWGGWQAFYKRWLEPRRVAILLQNRRSQDWGFVAPLERLLADPAPLRSGR